MELVGYACPYIPVELISAAGYQPYSLLHGDYELMQEGTRYARIDACPLARANIAYVIKNSTRFAACIGSIGCDMSRRMFDIIHEHADLPVYIIHMPRTDNRQIYSDEIDHLIAELNFLSKKDVLARLPDEIQKWNSLREHFRSFENQRAAAPSRVSTYEFHKAARSFYQGVADTVPDIPLTDSQNPRVYMVGSELSYESSDFLQLLEEHLCIVGDFVCGLSQFLNVSITTFDLAGVKNAYYTQAPCVYRRSNKEFFNHITQAVQARNCQGIIGFTLDYCDSYEFELKYIEKSVGLPMLRLRTDYSFQKISQLETRIAAFKEMLC